MNADLLQNQERVGTENVNEQLVLVLMLMVIGGRVSVTRDGREMIAVLNWRLIVMMATIMIKVRKEIDFITSQSFTSKSNRDIRNAQVIFYILFFVISNM